MGPDWGRWHRPGDRARTEAVGGIIAPFVGIKLIDPVVHHLLGA